MLSFLSDRRVLSVSAALITAAIFLFLLGTYPSWRTAIKDGMSWSRGAAPTAQPDNDAARTSALQPPAGPQPAPVAPQVSPAPAGSAPPPSASATPAKASDAGAPDGGAATRAEAAGAPPTFDIVRVEPTGDSVVAARAKAGAPVILLDGGRPIARAEADANGQVAFVPPPLSPGEHSLMLSVGEPNTPGAISSQSVAVSVPEAAKTAPMVALIQPDQPTRILSDTAPMSKPAGAPPTPDVSVSAIDVEEMGSVYATGKAAPGSHCRVYLNGSFVAPVTAGPDGKWSLKIERGMRPGHYAVRVDQIGSADGSVQARAEVPFDYPAALDQSVSLLRPRPGAAAPRVAAAGPGATSAGAPTPAADPQRVGATPPMPSAPASDLSRAQLSGSAGHLASAGSATDASAALPDASPAGSSTVVTQLLTTKVVRGDSLWRISRKMLGHGRHYTQIYAANTSQIRDPRLIYPGQIFVMPQAAP